MSGSAEEWESSILQTPTWVLALVFLCLVGFSFLFELALHFTTHFFQKKGRHGLAEALHKVVLELTMLGLFSLVLSAVSGPLSRVCVDYSPGMEAWTFGDDQHGCPCCLAHTKGISPCAQQYKQCLYNITDGSPYCDCDVTADYPGYEEAREQGMLSNECAPLDLPGPLLGGISSALQSALVHSGSDGELVEQLECEGPFVSTGCPAGQVLAIGHAALHEVDIWLFLLAVFHVTFSVLHFLLAQLRLRLQWHRWERQAQAQGQARAAEGPRWDSALLGGAASGFGRQLKRTSDSSSHGTALADASNGGRLQKEEAACLVGAGPPATDLERGTSSGGTATAGDEPQVAGQAGTAGVAMGNAAAAAVAADAATSGSTAAGASRKLTQPVAAMHGTTARIRHWAREAGACCLQALLPRPVGRRGFLKMRSIYLSNLPPEMAAQASAHGAHPKRHPPPQQQLSRHVSSHKADMDWDDSSAAGGGSFVEYVEGCLEHDISSFVGLSIEMILTIVIGLLLEKPISLGWVGQVWVMVAATVLFGINVCLVALLRYRCRGGMLKSIVWGRRNWLLLRRPYLLLRIPIRLVIFLTSWVFSTTAFVAWQFGPSSCFFSSTRGLWGFWSMPWWVGLVVASVLVLWTALVTIPTYSLAVHTPHPASMQARRIRRELSLASQCLQQAAAAERDHQMARSDGTRAQLDAEVANGLRATVDRLRAALAETEAALDSISVGGSGNDSKVAAGVAAVAAAAAAAEPGGTAGTASQPIEGPAAVGGETGDDMGVPGPEVAGQPAVSNCQQ